MKSDRAQGQAREVEIEIEIETEGGVSRVRRPQRAWLATPATGAGRGVLILQQGESAFDQRQAVCERLGRAGFVALAPAPLELDAVSGTGPDAAAPPGAVLETWLSASVDALRRRPEMTGARIGCLGLDRGDGLALMAACRRPEITAVVGSSGLLGAARQATALAGCRARILGLLAEHDEDGASDAVKAFESTLAAAGVEARMLRYAGVRPGFLNESRADRFDAATAARAWRDIESFLAAELA